MAVSGNTAITLIDLLRKPPDSSPAKPTGSPGQFQELFQTVRTDAARPAAPAEATQATAEAASASPTTSSEGVREMPAPETTGLRDATVVGREAAPRDTQVAQTTQPATTTAEPAASEGSHADAPASTTTTTAGADTSTGEASEQPKGDAPTDASVADGSDAQASQAGVGDASQEAVAAEGSTQVALVDPTLVVASADATATAVDVAAAEAFLTEVALVEGSTQTQDATPGAASVAPAVVEVVGQEAVAPTSIPVESPTMPTQTADTGAARMVGQEFPAGSAVPEKISTDQLIQALEARIAAQEASPSEVAAWRQAFSGGADEPSVLDQVWARAQSSGQSAFEPLAGMQGASVASQSATAGAPLMGAAMLAAAGAGGPSQLGTHPASGVVRSMSAQTDGAALSVRQGFALDARASQASESGSSLGAAQATLSRRAADQAFRSTRTVAQQAPRVVDMPADVATRFSDTEQGVRDAIVARQNRMHSFVRAQRARGVAPPPIVGGAGSGSGAEQATPVVGAVMTSATGNAAATPSAVTTHQAYTPLMEFLANEVRRNVRLGKREFRVQLNPEALGSVELEMVMDGEALTVRLKAASKLSQRILEENLGDLATALEAHGLGLDIEVPWQAERGMVEAAIAATDSQQTVPAWV